MAVRKCEAEKMEDNSRYLNIHFFFPFNIQFSYGRTQKLASVLKCFNLGDLKNCGT